MKIIIAPSKYIQGKGALAKLSDFGSSLGKKLFIISSEGGIRRGEPLIRNNLAEGVEVVLEKFNGECTRSEIERLREKVRSSGSDVVVGMGGGKTIDTAKSVSYFEKKPVIVAPTIASTDAPCSSLAVIYTDSGQFEEYLFFGKNPDMVIADTSVIAEAPPRLIISGMGDALATFFEAKACRASGAVSCAGGKTTLAAVALAELCYKTLLKEGLKAKLSVEAGVCTDAVENIIEANTYLSGIGFESAGLAAAHAVHNGLTVLKECHHMYHGEKVAFGTLVQLFLENADIETIEEVAFFCLEAGLPLTLEELGLKNATESELRKVAKASCKEGETIHNMPFPVDPGMVYSAIKAADSYGRHLSCF